MKLGDLDKMTSTYVASSSGGVGFFGALTLIFITLKLIDKIDWSWIWVLSPLWIPFLIFIAVVIIVLIVVGVVALFTN